MRSLVGWFVVGTLGSAEPLFLFLFPSVVSAIVAAVLNTFGLLFLGALFSMLSRPAPRGLVEPEAVKWTNGHRVRR